MKLQISEKKSTSRNIALILLATSLSAAAGELSKPPPEDLTFSNFFSTGWNEPWTRRDRGEGTPDMSLLRVQTNFVTQVFRIDYAGQENLGESSTRRSDSLSGTLEYALNRRFVLALIGNYRRIDSRTSEDTDGAAAAAFARVQWLDTATSSLAMTLRIGFPSHALNEKDNIISLAIAGWHDLAPFGLKRMGLYYHLQEETLAGPTKPGVPRNDLTYAVTLAKTWTAPESFFGNATTFLEGYGKTDLDGDRSSRTFITITPGIRTTFMHRHIVMAGVEFPLTDPQPYERIARLTYIYNF